MDALEDAEKKEPGVGLALLPVFFPDGLGPDEERWRDEVREKLGRIKAEAQAAACLADKDDGSSTPGSQASSDCSQTPSSVNEVFSSASFDITVEVRN